MEKLNLRDVESRVRSTGVKIQKHESADGWYYGLESPVMSELVVERPASSERIFSLLSLLLDPSLGPVCDHSLLWLHDRVYTCDLFSLGLLEWLSMRGGSGPGGTWDGYLIDRSEAERGALLASIIVRAEWDLFMIPCHGQYMVSFEHDRLIYYDRFIEADERLTGLERRLIADHAFERSGSNPRR
jgi:hypothetical protein